MKKASGFKMKNASVAKLAKAAGSPMRKDKPTYEEAWDNMESYESERGKFKNNMARGGTVYTDNEFGKAEFINDAKLYNAKQKNKNVVRIEPKKPTDAKKTMKTVAKPETKTRVGKFLSRVVGTGAKRKANEANKNKRQNRSVTGRMKAKASKFGRMGT
tara:strand:+ start:126 stop:602 length:477 start_codon:yes stop_codon:yes gene_type:complete